MIIKGSEIIAKSLSTGSGKNYPYTDSLAKSQILKSPLIFIDGVAAEVVKPGVEVVENVISVKVDDYKLMAKILELIASIYDDVTSDIVDEAISEFETTLENTR